MRILSRLLIIAVVLVGLAYSSYAVGRYALSKYLFGPQVTSGSGSGIQAVSNSTKVAESVTRQTDWKSKTPRVELKVLPAQEAGPGPDLPLAAMQEEQNSDGGVYVERKPSTVTAPSANPPAPPRHYAGSRNVDNAPLSYSLSGGDREVGRSEGRRTGEERPRRRRRRKKPTSTTSTRTTSPVPSADTDYYSAPDAPLADSDRQPAPVISDSGGSNSYADSSATRSSSSSSVTRPSTSTASKPTRRRRRRPARQRHESPLPRAEAPRILDGGDSPVPLPE